MTKHTFIKITSCEHHVTVMCHISDIYRVLFNRENIFCCSKRSFSRNIRRNFWGNIRRNFWGNILVLLWCLRHLSDYHLGKRKRELDVALSIKCEQKLVRDILLSVAETPIKFSNSKRTI